MIRHVAFSAGTKQHAISSRDLKVTTILFLRLQRRCEPDSRSESANGRTAMAAVASKQLGRRHFRLSAPSLVGCVKLGVSSTIRS